jgi:hypothetical protein
MQKRAVFLFLVGIFVLAGKSATQSSARREIRICDIPGYKTLKCDFHMHTVFSDGVVWPTVRVQEAWLEGLDAIAITDHFEYHPHSDDVSTDVNRSYEIAREAAEEVGLILIRGAEITKSMPPGHLNAVFITDAKPLDRPDWRAAVRAAVAQGAFVFWNHPGWRGQQADGKSRWYPELSELVDSGWVRGIEAVNEKEYYPEAFEWAIGKHLTLMGDSDVHDPISMAYDRSTGEHRPLTLVFAMEKSQEAVKEALFSRRTAVYYNDTLMGDPGLLKAVFEGSVRLADRGRSVKGSETLLVRIENMSDVSFELRSGGPVEDFTVPPRVRVPAHRTALMQIRKPSKSWTGTKLLRIPIRIANLKTSPAETLPVEWDVTVSFE